MSRTIDKLQATALSMHPWNNRREDWERLRECVFRLGRSAPVSARNALAAYDKRNATLPNPFAN
ncbi:hypothetical protein [Bradyrhizobium sp. USDA 4350]